MNDKSKEDCLKEAIQYFKRPCFKRLFEQLHGRCFSLGHLGGTVRIQSVTLEEADGLEGFLQKDCHNKKSISISVNHIRSALASTKFAKISLEELVIQYFGGNLISKKEQERSAIEEFKDWYKGILERYDNTPAGRWFLEMEQEQLQMYRNIKADFRKQQEWLMENISIILEAVNQLPLWKQEYQRVPIFAANISGNPHYFDLGERAQRYLLYAICYIVKIEFPVKMNAELRGEVLYRGGILIDDLSNLVLTYGIMGEDRGGNLHEGMEVYVSLREPLTLTLSNLTRLKRAKALNQVVYIVENPMVFYWLMERQKEKATAAIICSAGQPTQAVWLLLDLLQQSGTCMYYSGDFDPEGLLIAQRMKIRYQNHLKLWHYEISDYVSAKSKIELSSSSLKKLERLRETDLIQIGQLLMETRLAGYQENILQLYADPGIFEAI